MSRGPPRHFEELLHSPPEQQGVGGEQVELSGCRNDFETRRRGRGSVERRLKGHRAEATQLLAHGCQPDAFLSSRCSFSVGWGGGGGGCVKEEQGSSGNRENGRECR